MYRLYLYKAGLLFYGVLLVTLGIVVLAQGRVVLEVASVFGGVILILHGAHIFFSIIMKHGPFRTSRKTNPEVAKKLLPALIAGGFNVVCGLSAIFLPYLTIRALMFLFTVYVFLNATVKYIDFFIAKKNNSRRIFAHFAGAVFFTVFGVVTVMASVGIWSLLVVAGIYLILYGLCQLNDFLALVVHQRKKTGLRRGIRISLPVFVSAFMPYRFMNSFNRFLSSYGEDEEMPPNKKFVIRQKDPQPAEIELLIHVSSRGAGRMGHCDLITDGKVYSYGNYDISSSKLFRIYGDGVLFKADKEKYIEYSVEEENKIVICYGLRLNPNQVELIKNEIKLLEEQTYEWKPPALEDLENKGDGKSKIKSRVKTERRLRMWQSTDSKCYKFKTGRFKNYFVLSTNCVLLADSVLGKAGTDLIKINGIITPGSYFDYLQNQFFIEDGIVSSRVIHSRIARTAQRKRERAMLAAIENSDLPVELRAE
ncbi:MAG: DUF308 domain-containing protein [Oscillospiraceae bacterium]|nr:DUF308 domain-containing protein [Oscillospiraceae bacterium]